MRKGLSVVLVLLMLWCVTALAEDVFTVDVATYRNISVDADAPRSVRFKFDVTVTGKYVENVQCFATTAEVTSYQGMEEEYAIKLADGTPYEVVTFVAEDLQGRCIAVRQLLITSTDEGFAWEWLEAK